jgi:7-cyano-7-deazaguanine synthase
MQLSEKLFSEQSAKAVWVPNRNGVFIEVAASLAEAEGHSEITVGFNSEEAGTFPDNSEEYIRAISKALSYSTQNSVRVTSPTASLNKVDIVRHAKREHFPFSLIWSCYENGSKMCGKCESCMRLKRALHANEVAYAEMFTDQSFH